MKTLKGVVTKYRVRYVSNGICLMEKSYLGVLRLKRLSASLMLVILLVSFFPLLLITIYAPGWYVVEGMISLANGVSYVLKEFFYFYIELISFR